jgi:endonuclease YncB( thermonuclease family)
VKIYDGDTFTIASKLPYDASPLFRFSVHIRGLLSPDVRSVTPAVRDNAKISKTALSSMIYGKVVQLTNIEVDQCGNLVANVSINGIDINEWMVNNDYSDDYDSGRSKGGYVSFRRINTY